MGHTLDMVEFEDIVSVTVEWDNGSWFGFSLSFLVSCRFEFCGLFFFLFAQVLRDEQSTQTMSDERSEIDSDCHCEVKALKNDNEAAQDSSSRYFDLPNLRLDSTFRWRSVWI